MSNSSQSGVLYADPIGLSESFEGARVYVIDDESEVRRSLNVLLSTIGIDSWPFASASDFLDNLDNLKPAPILLDVRMPDFDGIQLMTILCERGVEWPVIVMTAHGEIAIAVQAIKLGAVEFLEKPFEFEILEISLQKAFSQVSAFNEANAVRDNATRLFALLSSREIEVVNVLMQGIANKVAAHLLSLSVRTIEMHRANALAKLRVKSMAEVVRLANLADLSLHSTKKS